MVQSRAKVDTGAGSWRAGLQGTTDFAELLVVAPETFISAVSKRAFEMEHNNLRFATPSAFASSRFVWANGLSWQLTPARDPAWHDKLRFGSDGREYAGLDFLTAGNDRRILAGANATIYYVCDGSISVNVYLVDENGVRMGLSHLDKGSVDFNSVNVGKQVSQGMVIGSLKPGTWRDPVCSSYTIQGPNQAHIHWILPTFQALTVDGWKIQYANNYLECVDASYCAVGTKGFPGAWFQSRNGTITPCPGLDGAIVVPDNDPNLVERSGPPEGFTVAGGNSVTCNGAAYTYSNDRSIENSYTWKPNLDRCGTWEIFAYLPWVDNQLTDTARARYEIRHRNGATPAGDTSEHVVDMAAENARLGSTQTNRWKSLGTYLFSKDAHAVGEYVRLGDTTGETGRSVNFDDLRFVFQSADPACDSPGTGTPTATDTTSPTPTQTASPTPTVSPTPVLANSISLPQVVR